MDDLRAVPKAARTAARTAEKTVASRADCWVDRKERHWAGHWADSRVAHSVESSAG